MELKATHFAIDRCVATITLHRPDRHNAWTGRMHTEYRWLMGEVQRNADVRVAVVTGAGTAFCVGGDSEALAGHAARGNYDSGVAVSAPVDRPLAELPLALDADFAFQLAMRVPVIVAVNGAAAGVGLAVALFADLRVGAAAAKLTTAAPKLGLPAEYGMSWMLPRLIGATRAAELLYTGRVFTPAETQSWGLWNDVQPDATAAVEAAADLAHRLATQVGPNALAATKRQLWTDVLHHDPAASIAESMRLLDVAMATAEYREGVAALREHRPPDFC